MVCESRNFEGGEGDFSVKMTIWMWVDGGYGYVMDHLYKSLVWLVLTPGHNYI